MTFNKIKYFLLPVLCISMLTPTYAVELPEGSVQGLPQNLIVMDTEGNSVSANGDFYVHVEDMQPGVLYTKDISVMNLRNDAVYHVYMSMAPNHTEGVIDLEGEVDVKLYLEGELIYTGDVNGIGEPNMQETPIDLGGIYNSGETRHLRAEFIWNMSQDTEKMIQERSEAGETPFGAVDFDWIFSASIKPSDDSTDEGTGGKGGSTNYGGGKSHVLNPPDDTKTSTDTDTNTDTDTDTNIDTDTGEESDTPGGETPDIDTDDNENGSKDKDITDKGNLLDIIAERVPFIPEDVKTGYHSRIVMYIKILLVSMAAAVLLIAGIIYKGLKLRNKESKQGIKQ